MSLSPYQFESGASGQEGALQRTIWNAQEEAWNEGVLDELKLAPERCEQALRGLAASARCFIRVGGVTGTTALSWDDGPAWALGIRWESGDDGGTLHGFLERDGERRPLTNAPLVIASGWVVLDGRIGRFDHRGAMPLALELIRNGSFEVSAGERDVFLRRLVELPGSPLLDIPDTERPEEVDPVPYLRVQSPEEHRLNRNELGCTLAFDYCGVRVAAGDDALIVVDERTDRQFRRNRSAEIDAVRLMLEAGAQRAGWRSSPHDAVIPVKRFHEIVVALSKLGWVVEAAGVRVRSAGDWSVSVASGIDWFDVKGGLTFDGETAAFPALLAAARAGSRTVALGDGSVGVLPERWLDRWGLLANLGEAEGAAVRVKRSQGWILDALLSTRDDVSVDRKFDSYRKKIGAVGRVEPGREPTTFNGELRPYQRDGLGWFAFLRNAGFGGCLADDMGLGKTVEVLAMLEHRRTRRGDRRPSLVVAPRSVVFNWCEEAARFAPRLSVLDYTGRNRADLRRDFGSVDLIVTTYTTLRLDILALREVSFDYVILDESQAIKNARSVTAKAARLLRADHRLALSGTPVENHLGELWSLFEFLNPGMLGRSKAFSNLINSGKGIDDDGRRALASALRPFILRRTKDQVLTDLPPKSEQIIHCELKGRQERDYREVARHFRASLLGQADDAGFGRMKIQVLEALLRLRQTACHPGLIDPSRADEDSAKIDVLLPMLQELADAGHKALVFSQFTTFLGIVRDRLTGLGVPFEYLDGRTRKRQEKVERFQNDPDCPVFLISLKAGGVGLNLTAASYVFLLDPWWNPAVEAQAIDRTHRIGQSKPVMTYRLIAQGTVEEKVCELQTSKRELAAAVLGEENAVLRDMTPADLALLLS